MSSRTKILVLLVVAALCVVIGRTFLKDSFALATLVAQLREFGTDGLAIPLYLLIFGLTTLFAPAVTMMVAAGVTWGFWPGWLLVWIAANLWANVHFVLSRWLGGDALTRWLTRRGAGWLGRELSEGGVMATIMVRQLPLPFPLVNLAAGASPIRWSEWILGNLIGLLPNCLIYTQLAAALADGLEGAKETALYRMATVATGIVAIGLLSRWLQRRRSRVSAGH